MADEIKKVIVIDVETGQAIEDVKDLKDAFAKAEEQVFKLALAGKQGTDEFKAAQQQAAGLKQEVDRINQSLDALKPEARVQAIGTVINGVAGAFSAATGAAALFGAESKEVEEALLKVQAAMAIQQGIQSIVEFTKQWDNLKKVLLGNPIFLIATVIIGIVSLVGTLASKFEWFGDIVDAVWGGVVAGAKAALNAVVGFIDTITFGLLSSVSAIDDTTKAQKKLADETSKATVEAGKLAGAYKKAADEVKKRAEEVVKAYDREIALARAAGKDVERLEAEKLEVIRKSLAEQIRLRTMAAEKEQEVLQNVFGKGFVSEKIKADRKKSLDELKKQFEDTNLEIEVKEAESLKRRQDKYVEYLNFLDKAAAEDAANRQRLLDEAQKDLDEYLKTVKLIKEEEVVINIDALDSIDAKNKEKLDKENDYNIESYKNYKEAQALRVQTASDTLGVLLELNDAFVAGNEKNAKKAFEINKALSIADAIIKTYQAANSAFATASANPATTFFPAYPFIQAGLAIASGLAQVAKIRQTKFEGGASGGGAPSIGGGSIPAPNTGGNNQINSTLLDRQAIEAGQNTTQENRVYVVESDISQSQARVNGIVNRATVR